MKRTTRQGLTSGPAGRRPRKTKLGVGGTSVANIQLEGKKQKATSSKASGPFTRQNVNTLSRGPLGDFSGRHDVAPNVVDLAKITAASTVPAITIVPDVVVELVGLEVDPTILAVTVIQAGQRIDLAVISQTTTVPQIQIAQIAAGNQDVFLEVIGATATVNPIEVDFENVVDLLPIAAATTVNALEVDFIGIGQLSLTPADILAIRNSMLDWEVETGTGLTLRNLYRALYAEVAGVTVGDPGAAGIFGYRAAGTGEDGPIRVAGQVDGQGKRFTVTNDG